MESIIFVHKGNDFYLHLAVKQAIRTNPTIKVILLGDESNKNVEGACHFLISDYFKRAEALSEIYVHHSPNGVAYELFCFQRWLVIWEFMQKHPEYDDRFVYCDSDTLLFSYVKEYLNQLGNHPLGLENGLCPAFTFFNKGTLSEICTTIEGFYNTEVGKQYWQFFVDQTIRENKIFGFSDMYAFEYYGKFIRKGEVVNLDIPQKDLQAKNAVYSCYDQSINLSDGFETDKNGKKNIKWKQGIPYCYSCLLKKDVRFKGIHFQGRDKFLMAKALKEPIFSLKGDWKRAYLRYRLQNVSWLIRLYAVLKKSMTS